MEGATRSTMSYLDKLAKFHRQQGTTFTRPPSLDGRPIDLYQLKRAVDSRGGFKEACRSGIGIWIHQEHHFSFHGYEKCVSEIFAPVRDVS